MNLLVAFVVSLCKYLFEAAPGTTPRVLKVADVVRSVVVAFTSGGLASAVSVVVAAAGIGGPQSTLITSAIVAAIGLVVDLYRRYLHGSPETE